jgi:hypothetical protein
MPLSGPLLAGLIAKAYCGLTFTRAHLSMKATVFFAHCSSSCTFIHAIEFTSLDRCDTQVAQKHVVCDSSEVTSVCGCVVTCQILQAHGDDQGGTRAKPLESAGSLN